MSTIGLTAIVAEDEPVIRSGISTILRADGRLAVVAECGDGTTALEAIETLAPGVAFLDIKMPGLTGFDVVDALPAENRPLIVFITAYDEHALEAFDVCAVDYVLKPFDEERLTETIRRVVERLEHADRADDGVDRLLQQRGWLTRVAVRQRGHVRLLPVEDVDSFQAAGNYVRVHAGAASWPVRHTLKGLLPRLNPEVFVRIHRSTIVNLTRVKELAALATGDYTITLENGGTLTLSRTFKNEFERRIGWSI